MEIEYNIVGVFTSRSLEANIYIDRAEELFLFREMMTVLHSHVEMFVVQSKVFELPLVQVELVQAALLHPADISCGGVHELQTLVEEVLSQDG